MRKKVTQITEDAALPRYIPDRQMYSLGRGYVMTSNSTCVLLYTILGTLLMLSSIYVPA